jgi:hypothetical protein
MLFSDEKMSDIDGVYNSQNQRIWLVDRTEADASGGIRHRRLFPQKSMVWLAACSQEVYALAIFAKDTVDHARYIREVLPIVLKYGNSVFANDWTFQPDVTHLHTHEKSQEWCAQHFPSFIDKDHWPPNSPDLNPLD